MKEIRFPADKGVAGHVYRTGEPLIVPNTSKDPHFFSQVDEKARYQNPQHVGCAASDSESS